MQGCCTESSRVILQCATPGCSKLDKRDVCPVHGERVLPHGCDSLLFCFTCDKPVRSERELRRHVERHSSTKAHVCPHCSMRFGRSDVLRRHIKTLHEATTLHCGHCASTFTRADKLAEHVNKKHGDSGSSSSSRSNSGDSSGTSTPDNGAQQQQQQPITTMATATTAANVPVARCACGQAAAPHLGEVLRCCGQHCSASFHWFCAGYDHAFTPLLDLVLCSKCRSTSGISVAQVQEAATEARKLAAYLALQRWPQVSVRKVALFSALAVVAGREADDVKRAVLHAIVDSSWAAGAESQELAMKQCALQQDIARPWPHALLAHAWTVLPAVLSGAIVVVQVDAGAGGGVVAKTHGDGEVIALLCALHSALYEGFYDVVICPARANLFV